MIRHQNAMTLPPHLDEVRVGIRRVRVQLVCWPCSSLLTGNHEPANGHMRAMACRKGTKKARARFLRQHRRCGFL